MIEHKDYLIRRKKIIKNTNIASLSGVGSFINQFDFYFHKVIFADISTIVAYKLMDLRVKSAVSSLYTHTDEIHFLVKFDKSFNIFSWDYSIMLKKYCPDIFVRKLEEDFLYFLLYLYDIINNDKVINAYSTFLADKESIMILSKLKEDLYKKSCKDRNLFKKYLTNYLKTRKEIEKKNDRT